MMFVKCPYKVEKAVICSYLHPYWRSNSTETTDQTLKLETFQFLNTRLEFDASETFDTSCETGADAEVIHECKLRFVVLGY